MSWVPVEARNPHFSSKVTSIVLCQQERGADFLHFVLMGEDSEKDAVHGGSVLEGAHGPGAPSDLAEAAVYGIGGAHGLALGQGLVAETGEQLVEVVAQAIDGLGVVVLPAVGEAARGRAGGRLRRGVHGGMGM